MNWQKSHLVKLQPLKIKFLPQREQPGMIIFQLASTLCSSYPEYILIPNVPIWQKKY